MNELVVDVVLWRPTVLSSFRLSVGILSSWPFVSGPKILSLETNAHRGSRQN
jgi:hypothetical protein